MSEPYTIYPAYSGPFRYDPAEAPEPVVVDVFGMDMVKVTKAPTNYPGALRTPPVPFQFTLQASMSQWVRVRSDLPAGVYRWTYLSGALCEYATPVGLPWNQGYPGPYSGGNPAQGPTARVWIRCGQDIEHSYWFPGFDYEGYPSAEIAEGFTKDRELTFYHPGGDLDISYDPDSTLGPAQGAITFQFVNVPLPAGSGFWERIWSSLPNVVDWPSMDEGEKTVEFPTIRNLSPGVHHFRFYNITPQREYRWQDYWFWVWKTQPREAKFDAVTFTPISRDQLRSARFASLPGVAEKLPWEIYPVREAKVVSGDRAPFKTREKLMQPPKTAGNYT